MRSVVHYQPGAYGPGMYGYFVASSGPSGAGPYDFAIIEGITPPGLP
jgi:hypothetical protein